MALGPLGVRLLRLRRRVLRLTAPWRFGRRVRRLGLTRPRGDNTRLQLDVLIDLRAPVLGQYAGGRFLYLLVHHFCMSNRAVHMTRYPWVHHAFLESKFLELLLVRKRVRFVGSASDVQSVGIHIRDHDEDTIEGQQQLTVRFGYDLTLDPGSYDILFPYSLHPLFYETGAAAGVRQLRGASARRRVAFSGNVKAGAYDPPLMEKRFGMLSRNSALAALRTGLEPRQLRVVQDTSGLLADAAGDIARCLIVLNIGPFRVPKEQWLTFLSETSFFLALPGTEKPLAHNLIEAMSVGAVPILQYQEYLDPPLRDGFECLAYTSADHLVEQVRRALQMDPGEIARMSACVSAYYDEHLTCEMFMRRIKGLPKSPSVLGFNSIREP